MCFVTVKISLNTAQLDKIAAGLNTNTDNVLGLVATDLSDAAKGNAPVDTGLDISSAKGWNSLRP